MVEYDMLDRLAELIQLAKVVESSIPEYDEIGRNMAFAHFLINNGVTVQEWISVKDRLPENICPVLVSLEGLSTAFNGWYHDGKWWTVGAGTRPFIQKATHWMPLPQPPKGE